MQAIIQVMESTLGARDPYTVDHQQRTTQIAIAIAERMGLPPESIEAIHVAGSLHDLGKIAVPHEILSKPGKLTDLEYAIIKTHPQVACNILKPLDIPVPIPHIILQHHERMNGSGYPHGLEGQDILLESKILGVADVVEAMCSHRPYRPALGIEKALDEISRKKGILYDSKVVDSCLLLYQETPAALMGEVCHIIRKPITPLDALPQKTIPNQGDFRDEANQGRWSFGARLIHQPRFFLHLAAAAALGWFILMVGHNHL
jgi:HD-GYP domain-containing protein (c-di-GMP phosphodiesterase class II)